MASKQDTTPAAKTGRKPLAKAEPAGPEPDQAALAERSQELQVLAKAEAALQSLATSIGYAGALDTESLWAAVEYRQRRSVEDILEMGRGLLLIKEQCAHGEFQQQIAARGIQYRTAARFMGVALKFSKSDSVSLLKAAGTQAKVMELAMLDDSEIAALESGESVGGIVLDDVERMSASQLREALRDMRANVDAKDQRIEKLSADVNKAEEKAAKAARKWKSADPDEQQVTLEQRIVEAKHATVATIGSEKTGLVAAFLELADHCNRHDLDCRQFMGDTLDELIAAVRRVRDDYGYGFAVDLAIDKEA